MERKTFRKTPSRRRQDGKPHVSRSRSSRLAASQSMNFSWADLTRASRSSRTCPCQEGDWRSSSLRLKSAHNASITRSFSARVVWSSGSVTSISLDNHRSSRRVWQFRGRRTHGKSWNAEILKAEMGRGANHRWTQMDTDAERSKSRNWESRRAEME